MSFVNSITIAIFRNGFDNFREEKEDEEEDDSYNDNSDGYENKILLNCYKKILYIDIFVIKAYTVNLPVLKDSLLDYPLSMIVCLRNA